MTWEKGLFTSVILLFLMSSLLGCGLFHYLDGSTQEEIEQRGNPVLWKKTSGLEEQNRRRQDTETALSARINDLQGSLSKMDASLKQLEGQVGQITAGWPREETSGAAAGKGALAALRDDAAQMNERVKRLEAAQSAVLRGDMETIQDAVRSIKVLSGTGKLAAAKKMTLRLSNLGYRVDRIDLASRKTFQQNVVFYRAPSREAAAELAAKIGGRTVARPMTWRSQYGIIVVSVMK